MKKYIIFGLTLFTLPLIAQNEYIPQISSPSPTAYSLGKYGDVPVGKYTGIPNIDIPLYTIKNKSIEIPISISYHAGGIKVAEEASKVGLGWTLNAGGMITQSVAYGNDLISDYVFEGFETGSDYYWGGFCGLIAGSELPESGSEGFFGFPEFSYSVNRPDLDNRDPQIDIFHFNFLGYSGKFIFDKKNQEVVLLDQQPIKFKVEGEGLVNKYWNVILPDGTKLKLDQRETMTQWGGTISNITWYLTSITTIKGETIELTYEQPELSTENISEQIPFVYEKSVREQWINASCSTGDEPQPFILSSRGVGNKSFLPAHLKKISFEQGQVDFEYASREDVHNNLRLTNIKVSTLSEKLIHNYELGNDAYFVSSIRSRVSPNHGGQLADNHYTHRLKLNELKELISGQVHTFSYNPTLLPMKDSYAVDYWGYYSGNLNADTFVPDISKFTEPDATTQSIQSDILEYYSAFAVSDRSANPDYVDASVLEKIVYPTGGSMIFEYESNTFSNQEVLPLDEHGNSIGGGLRISKIIADYGEGQESVTSFDYSTYSTNVSSGIHLTPLSFSKKFNVTQYYRGYSTTGGCGDCQQTYKHYAIESNSQITLSYGANGRPIGYSNVLEKRDVSGEVGSTEYVFYNQEDTRFYYSWAALGASPPTLSSPLLGKPKEVIARDSEGVLVKKKKYIYKEKNKQNFQGMIGFLLNNEISGCNGIVVPTCSTVGYVAYQQNSYRVDLDQEEEIEFVDGVQSLSKVTDYKYNSNGFVIETREENSKEDVLMTYYKYPTDFSQYSDFYKAMANENQNMVNYPVEIVETKNGLTISVVYNEYDCISANGSYGCTIAADGSSMDGIPVIRSIQKLEIDEAVSDYSMDNGLPSDLRLKEEISISKYDKKGNVIETLERSGVKTSYIWGYDNILPIAKGVNCTIDDLRCTSFEKGIINLSPPSASFDKWILLEGGTVTSDDHFTGEQSICRSTGTMSLATIGPFDGKYIIGTALKGIGSISIGGVAQGEIDTGEEWQYFRFFVELENVEGLQIEVSGDLCIDELRLHNADAILNTYTHEPGIGMISETDENCLTTFYEYDDFGRLEFIKDQDGNILKTFLYHYYDQN